MLTPRPLGRTGLMVSPLGLGTVKLGRNVGVKYPAAFEIPDDVKAADLLRRAQKLGITLLDTAPAYGGAEEKIGRIIGSCGGRDRWTIITKAGEEFDAATGESRFAFSPAAITMSVERSLRRLKTNHLDVVLLHSDGRDEWIMRESGAVEALARLKKKGMVRAIGISAKSAEGAMAALGIAPGCHGQRSESASGVGRGGGDRSKNLDEASPLPPSSRPTALSVARVDVLMVTLNAGDQSCLPAIRAAHERGVGVLIKKAFASGHALGPPGGLEGALRFSLDEPGVSAVVVGTINPAHLEENARAAASLLP